MNMKYLCYICRYGKAINRVYLPLIPRIGEQVNIYNETGSDFGPYKIVNVEYTVDAHSKLEPIIKLHI